MHFIAQLVSFVFSNRFRIQNFLNSSLHTDTTCAVWHQYLYLYLYLYYAVLDPSLPFSGIDVDPFCL